MTDQYNIEKDLEINTELYINTNFSIPESPHEICNFNNTNNKSFFSKTETLESITWSDISVSNSWRSFTNIIGWTVITPKKHRITIMDVWRCWTDLFWFAPSKYICECISKVKTLKKYENENNLL